MAIVNSYHIGQEVKCLGVFKDTASALIDPTTITFRLATPDGSSTSLVYGTDAAVVKETTGTYYVNYVTTGPGLCTYRFIGTGTVKAAFERKFNVLASRFT